MIKKIFIIGFLVMGLVFGPEGRAQGLVVIGKGYLPRREDISLVRRRLLARRAAVLDAYRKLALAKSGVPIPRNGKIHQYSFIRGAKIKDVRYFPDGMVEVEMVLE